VHMGQRHMLVASLRRFPSPVRLTFSLRRTTLRCTCMNSKLLQVRGTNVPKPVKAWTQAGLSSKVCEA